MIKYDPLRNQKWRLGVQRKSSLIRWNEQVSSMFLDTPKVGVQGFLRSLL